MICNCADALMLFEVVIYLISNFSFDFINCSFFYHKPADDGSMYIGYKLSFSKDRCLLSDHHLSETAFFEISLF